MGASSTSNKSCTFAIEALELEKSFGAVRANAEVTFGVPERTVHAIIGENGAGKSTLMNMLYGLYRPDSGEIRVDGSAVDFASPREAHDAGIGMVHQHFMLVENFTVLENVMLGFEGGALLSPHVSEVADGLREIEEAYGLQVPINALISDLPVGLQQRVEILKALYRGADTLILDEPTGVLTPQEAEQLFEIIGTLREQGKTVLFISHKLGEVMRIADKASIMRHGEIVAERRIGETSEAELAELMVGQKVGRACSREAVDKDTALLVLDKVGLKNTDAASSLHEISLSVHTGEIVGIAGVAGNGQGELLEVITGMRPPASGHVIFGGEMVADPTTQTDPLSLRQMGMGHIAEDRLRIGAIAGMTAAENAILGYHRDDRYDRLGVQKPANIRLDCVAIMEKNDVRPPVPEFSFGNFSGGNQQKLVIGRELQHDPKLLIIGQPTRGVDIGAVTRIHDQLIAMRNSGKALLVVSSDLDELLAIADRILVMFEGRIVGEVAVEKADEQTLGLMMAGSTTVADAREGSNGR